MDRNACISMEDIVSNAKDISTYVFDEILENAHKLKDPKKAYNKLARQAQMKIKEGLIDISEVKILIGSMMLCKVVTEVVKKLNDLTFAKELMKILEGDDECVYCSFKMIASAHMFLFKDEKKAREILTKAEKQIMGLELNIFTAYKDETPMDKARASCDNARRCENLLLLASAVDEILKDKRCSSKLISEAEEFADGFDNFIELGEYYIEKGDKEKAKHFLQTAYAEVEFRGDLCKVAYAAVNLLKDRAWGIELLNELINMTEAHYELSAIASIIANGELKDKAWAGRVLRKALQKAGEPEQILSVSERMQDILGSEMADKILNEME